MSGGDTRLLGRWGEAAVAADLRKKGWNIIAAGYRTRFGEIDLIAERGDFLVFVEVKLRKDDSFAPACAFVTPQKQNRLRLTAESWLATHPSTLQPRFDVAQVYAPDGMATKQPSISYITNAF